MRSKGLQIIVAAGALALISGFIPLAEAQSGVDVEGQVNIVGAFCGLEVTGGAPINYGDLTNNQESGEHQLSFINNGNIEGDTFLRGTNWHDTSPAQLTTMDVGDTHWGTQGVAYDTKTALTDQDVGYAKAYEGISYSTYFQLKPTLITPTFTGDAVQTVTLSISC